ncbi:hypothetical protein ACWDV7_27040 [Streptomyces sp. NPDC003362]
MLGVEPSTPGLTRRVRAGAEPEIAAATKTASAKAVTVEQSTPSKDPRCVAFREAPAEVSDALETDFVRRGHEMIERMSADGNEEALSKLGAAPVERQTQAFL